MKTKNIITSLSIILLITGCSNQNTQKTIETLEKTIYSNKDASLNMENATSLIDAYIKFSDENPKDSKTPTYLFKAGEIAMGISESEKSIACYNRVHSEYPTFEKAPTAMFLEGFVYETQLKALAAAQKIYLQFIKKHPNHNLVDDAQFSLKNLGKSDEDIIKEFEEKQAKKELEAEKSITN